MKLLHTMVRVGDLPRAIAFYRKAGYAEVGTHVFVVGRDPQTDRIMTRALAGMGAA